MNPAFSIIFFTMLAGCAQGLVVAVAIIVLGGIAAGTTFLLSALALAEALLLAGLGSSFLHLGSKMRAWRAVLMWRTSWMSREVIVLPALLAAVGGWWLALMLDAPAALYAALPLICLLLAAALWYCTAMIYVCLRFVQEWAHPLTVINYTLIGLSSGLVLVSALAAVMGEQPALHVTGPCAVVVTLAAWTTRMLALRRNAALTSRSTLQSATGIKAEKLVQKSMGMSAGSFNTREFFHGVGHSALKRVKLLFILLAFALPSLLLAWGVGTESLLAFVLAPVLQLPGLFAERWFFFAQARHPQNLYYQVVS